MIGKPVALIQVPNQRLFSPQSAAKYLGVCDVTLAKLTREGKVRAKWHLNRKVYTLDSLDSYIEGLPDYNACECVEKSGATPKDRRVSDGIE